MTETTDRPLTKAELTQLSELVARYQAGQAPAVRTGDPYQVLINVSLPRRGDPTHQSDLVMAGEIVHLTPEEVRLLNRHGSRDGRQVEILRPAPGGKAPDEPFRMHPRAVSGRIMGPPQGARPDPDGSSAVQVLEVPESQEPQLGSENSPQVEQDAVDLPPRNAPRAPRGQTRR